jgi:hypothetical protein
VFKLHKFGVEDIFPCFFPQSVIHFEALVGDSFVLLMWQYKYALVGEVETARRVLVMAVCIE